jgi:hypothetical protein
LGRRLLQSERNAMLLVDVLRSNAIPLQLHLPGKAKSPGAKAQTFVEASTARLKSCPDTGHQSSDNQKICSFRRFELFTLSEM